MACYIASNNNRFYVARETGYGVPAAVTAADRFPAAGLGIREEREAVRRRDKTGTRTFQGVAAELRRRTQFEVKTYLASRDEGVAKPRYGALVESAMGENAVVSGGGMASANGLLVQFQAAHGLSEGMAVTAGAELRMVSGVVDAQTVVVSAPFTPWMGTALVGGGVSYGLSETLPSVTLYDYWSPETAVQRMVRGAVVDEMEMEVNGDFHELRFAGVAAELRDSATEGAGYPAEPPVEVMDAAPVLGHLGQMWIGLGPSQLHTVTSARVRVRNNIEARTREFGSLGPRCIAPGEREVTAEFELYSRDTAVFEEVYQAARWRQPVSLMLQMGDRAGQMAGLWMKSFVPETPEFLDEETRLRWQFRSSRAQGGVNDELWIAFG